MRQLFMLCLLAVAVGGLNSGCAARIVREVEVNADSVAPSDPTTRLSVGMSRTQALQIMEGTVVAGFEIDSATGQQKPIRIRRLYSTEVVTVGGTDYVVDRFLLKPPGKDTDKELYPVVFKDNILVDKGPAALTLIEKK